MPGPVAAAYFYEELFGAEGGGDKGVLGIQCKGAEKEECGKYLVHSGHRILINIE